MMEPSVVLVNEKDEAIGLAPKQWAHQKGLLHRAFSIFILHKVTSNQYQVLLQQRAQHKYHCAGLWTNSCCSHPYENEPVLSAATRRLHEELGLTVPLQYAGQFTYYAMLPNQLIEHEIDHVFIGFDNPSNMTLNINPEEIMAYQWMDLGVLREKIEQDPHAYTPWLLTALDCVEHYLNYPTTE